MFKKISLLVLVLLFFNASFVFAAWQKPGADFSVLYRNDIRHSEENIWIERLNFNFLYDGVKTSPKTKNSIFKLSPFFEYRWNIKREKTERKALGIEAGLQFTPWLYFGDEIRYAWRNEALKYRRVYDDTQMAEMVFRLVLKHRIIPERFIKRNIQGFIINDYTYDLTNGEGTRNEVSVGVIVPLVKYIDFIIAWRHVDRVHYFDCDTFEGGIKASF